MLVNVGVNQWVPYRAKRFTEGAWKFPLHSHEVFVDNIGAHVPRRVYEDPIDLSLLAHWWWLRDDLIDPLKTDDSEDLTASAGVTFNEGALLPVNEYLAGTVTLPASFTLAGCFTLDTADHYFNLLTDVDTEANFTVRTLYTDCSEGVNSGIVVYCDGVQLALFDTAIAVGTEVPYILTVTPTEVTLTLPGVSLSHAILINSFPKTVNVRMGTVDAYGGVALSTPEGTGGRLRSVRLYNGLLSTENHALLLALMQV